MIISELIKELETFKNKHGDLEVEIMQWTRDLGFDIDRVEYVDDSNYTNGKPRAMIS